MIYLPVTTKALGEYLSSGYIGVFSSVEPYPDAQNALFPDVTAFTETPSEPFEVLIRVDDSLKRSRRSQAKNAYANDGAKIFKGPIPVSRVSRIIFRNDEDLNRFANTYSAFPDIPLHLFELEIEEAKIAEGEALLPNIDDADSEKSEPEAKAIRVEPYPASSIHLPSLCSTLIGYAKCVSLLSTPDIEQKYSHKFSSMSSLQSKFSKILLDYSSAYVDTSSNVKDIIDEYFKAIEEGEIGPKSRGASIVSTLKSRLTKNAGEGIEDTEANEKAVSFLTALERTLLGLEEPPVMHDKPTTVLQRAFYLSCVVDSFEDLETIRPQKHTGRYTNAFAHFLLSCRQKLSFTMEDYWRKNRENLDCLLEVANSFYGAKSMSVESHTDWEEEFQGRNIIKINGVPFYERLTEPDSDKAHVISSLKRIGYAPKRSRVSAGSIQVDVRLSEDTSIPVFFDIIGQHAVKMSAPTETKISSIRTSAALNRLLSVSDEYNVALRSGSNLISVSRRQLIDTMDKEEVKDHLLAVASAARAISEQD